MRIFYWTNEVPAVVLDKVSKIPGIGSTKMQKDVSMLKLLNEKLKDFYEMFEHFVSGEWIYETKKIYEFEQKMSTQDKEIFYIDPRKFDWKNETYRYGFGVEHFMNKQDIYDLSQGQHMALLRKNKFRNFDSFRRVFFENQIISQDTDIIRKEATAS